MDELNNVYGVDADGYGYAFGPENRCTKISKDGWSERFQYAEMICLPNDRGYKVEWDMVREDGSVTRIHIYGLQHNLDLMEQYKEEQLWQS